MPKKKTYYKIFTALRVAEQSAYDIICQHFLAAVTATPATIRHHHVTGEFGGEMFVAHSYSFVNRGFLEVAHHLLDDHLRGLVERNLGHYVVGQVFRFNQPNLANPVAVRMDTIPPPPLYNEADMVEMMDLNGMGTPASRPGVVERLLRGGKCKLYTTIQEKVFSLILSANWNSILMVSLREPERRRRPENRFAML